MGFFATGGLQQLLSDLNCDEIFESQHVQDCHDLRVNEHITQDSLIKDNYLEPDTYDILNITHQVEDPTYEWCQGDFNLTKDEPSDWLANLLDCQEIEFNADNLITRELAEWEDKFLENFIEIPELIDILPDKTPLCTDNCEIFLRESSKILQLDHQPQILEQLEPETDKSFVCTFGTCNKIYAKPAHLKAHLRRHLGEKPYACTWPECTWKFSRSDELARHRRSHSGVKPYKCDYCSKCFARSDHLTKHRKVHERRMLAASAAGVMPQNVFNVRPGRRRKNTIY